METMMDVAARQPSGERREWFRPLRLLVVFVTLNLMFAMTTFISGSDAGSRTYINNLLNLIPVAILLFFTLRDRKRFPALVPNWAIALLVFTYTTSMFVNFSQHSRTLGTILFVWCLILSIRKPHFFSRMFEVLVEKAHWIALIFGGMVFAFNHAYIRWNFYYPKGWHFFAAPFSNPNKLCQPLDITVIILAALLLKTRTKVRKAVLFGLLLFITNLILATSSRGGILQLAFVWFIVAAHQINQMFSDRYAGIRRAALGLMFLVILVWGYRSVDIDLIWDQAVTDYRIPKEFDDSGNSRYPVWRESIRQLRENDWYMAFGRGSGNDLIRPVYGRIMGLRLAHSHSAFLNIINQFGIFFFIALCIVFAYLYLRFFAHLLVSPYRYHLFLLFASTIHPFFETYYFYTYGTASDMVRLGLLSFLVVQTARISSEKRAARRKAGMKTRVRFPARGSIHMPEPMTDSPKSLR